MSLVHQSQHSASRSAFSVKVSIQYQGHHSMSTFIIKVSIQYQGQHSVSRSAFSVNVNIQCKGQPLVSRSAFNIKVSVKVNIKFHNQHSEVINVSRDKKLSIYCRITTTMIKICHFSKKEFPNVLPLYSSCHILDH